MPENMRFPMKVSVKKVPNHPDLFEFTIATAALRTQFRLPRENVNQLRILVEKALMQREKEER